MRGRVSRVHGSIVRLHSRTGMSLVSPLCRACLSGNSGRVKLKPLPKVGALIRQPYPVSSRSSADAGIFGRMTSGPIESTSPPTPRVRR